MRNKNPHGFLVNFCHGAEQLQSIFLILIEGADLVVACGVLLCAPLLNVRVSTRTKRGWTGNIRRVEERTVDR